MAGNPGHALVTGGAGFIGSHIVESLLRQGYEVAVFDNFSSGSSDNLSGVQNDVEVIRGDILDADALRIAMRGKQVVSHHAAQLEITKCLNDPVDDLRINLIGTINVLLAARDAGAERVINASSACVYGQAAEVPTREEGPHDPNWAYGASKLAAEKYAQIFARDYGLKISSFRYGIVYGAREWYGRVLTIFLKRALEGRPPVVFGAGEQIRDFVNVADVVQVNDACLRTNLEGAHAYNVGTGVGTSIANLAEQVRAVAGLVPETQFEAVAPGEYSSLVDGRMRLPAELGAMQLSPEKIQRTFGIGPLIPLEEGLATQWAWLRDNADRWRELHY